MNLQHINEEIAALARQERNLEMELDDALTDITSAENSDSEDEIHNEEDDIVRLFKNCILNANGQPTELCSFIMRYEDPNYRRSMRRKMKKMKNKVKASDIQAVLSNPVYMVELERIRRTYPNHGGREFLNELIATYIVSTY
jgi:hypothetical protein